MHRSVFFNEQISVSRIYAHTAPRTGPASPERPISQERRVHLLVGPARKLVCIATSTVHLRSPAAERLFLDEQHAIGQCFRALGRPPAFTLHRIDARTGATHGRRELARTYTLATDDLESEIEEVFPDRDMFDACRAWLEPTPPTAAAPPPQRQVAVRSSLGSIRAFLSFLGVLGVHRKPATTTKA
jgi:hypothetical protein